MHLIDARGAADRLHVIDAPVYMPESCLARSKWVCAEAVRSGSRALNCVAVYTGGYVSGADKGWRRWS